MLLLCVPSCQRQVQDKGDPITIDQEHECKESLDGGFGDDVGVEAVAKVDWVDVVTMRTWVSALFLAWTG